MLVANDERVPFESLTSVYQRKVLEYIKSGVKKIEVLFEVPITTNSYEEIKNGRRVVAENQIRGNNHSVTKRYKRP